MTYTTQKGDTWDIIAYKHYGNEAFIKPLITANPEYTETAVFDFGITLHIPEIEKTDSSIYIPPWRG